MSDNDDDYMCEEEEDYGLVCRFINRNTFFNIIVCSDVLKIATKIRSI